MPSVFKDLSSLSETASNEKKNLVTETTVQITSSEDTQKQDISFDALPLQPNHPPFSAWGMWGRDDELGALNYLTPEVVKRAASEITHGITVPLNLPIESPLRPMNPMRKPCEHRIIAKGRSNDDELNINTQGSSHFDGLRHVPYQETLQFYNGTTQEEIMNTMKLGIQNVARRGVAGRGVLLDWYRYATAKGIEIAHFGADGIPLSELLDVAKEQNVEFRPGDILLIRTGWTAAYNALPESTKLSLPDRDVRATCGVEASWEALKWHWERQFAAVASDTVAYEAWPSPRPAGVSMHEVFLSGWGMMIGECWDLEGLSRECERVGTWSFFLTCQVLNLEGGVASPSCAVAIL